MREGCIYFGPPGDPIRSLLEHHGVQFEDFDNRFGSMSPGGAEPIYVEDFGGPALPCAEIALSPMRGTSLGDRLGCYPQSLAKPLGHSGQFPRDIVEMISVGEEANNLEQVLVDIADNLERRTSRELELSVRLLEPLMLVLMAGVVLFVVVALLLPILQSSSAV